MIKSPKISVLMAVYNTKEEYLRQSIESILNQTFTDFEFIIINDGSTDKRIEDVIKSYDDERIKYIYQSNQGLPVALNNGLDNATGKYVARMDSDDISHPDRLEKQYMFMESNPDVGVCGTLFKMFGQKSGVSPHPENVSLLTLLKGCYIGHPTVMMRKDVLDKYNIRYDINFRSAQDYELWSRMVRVTKIKNIMDVLLDYRFESNNISSSKAAEQARNADLVRKRILEFLTSDTTLHKDLLDMVFNKKSNNSIFKKWFKK